MKIESKFNQALYKYRVLSNLLPVILGFIVFCFEPHKNLSLQALFSGLIVLFLGFLLRFWVAIYNWVNIDSQRPQADSGIITNGPYQYCRNPVYLAAIILITGFSLIFNSLYVALAMIIPTILLHLWQIKYEEVYLEGLFGEAFLQYRKQVPSLIPYKLKCNNITPNGKPNWKRGIQNDIGPLFGAISFIIIVLILLPFLKYNITFLLIAGTITVLLNGWVVSRIQIAKARVKEIPSTAPPFILTIFLRKWLFPAESIIKKLKLSPSPDFTALDFGCGPGFYTIPLAKAIQGKVIALDIRIKMLDILKKKASKAGVGNVEYLKSDSDKLPLAPNSVDMALLFLVIGEIINPGIVASELERILKKDGFVYILESKFDDHFQTPEEVKTLFDNGSWNIRMVEQKKTYYLLELAKN